MQQSSHAETKEAAARWYLGQAGALPSSYRADRAAAQRSQQHDKLDAGSISIEAGTRTVLGSMATVSRAALLCTIERCTGGDGT